MIFRCLDCGQVFETDPDPHLGDCPVCHTAGTVGPVVRPAAAEQLVRDLCSSADDCAGGVATQGVYLVRVQVLRVGREPEPVTEAWLQVKP